MEQRVPQNAEEVFAFYGHHLQIAAAGDRFAVPKLGMTFMVNEYKRLREVERLYEELKAKRPVGRPRKNQDGGDEASE